MQKITFLFVLGLLSLTATVWAQQHAPKDPNVIIGKAFWDNNGNGLQEADEPGVAGVEVNDEWNSTLSDASGHFALRIRQESNYVRFTVPEGYRLVNTLCLDVSRWENRNQRSVPVPLVKLNHD